MLMSSKRFWLVMVLMALLIAILLPRRPDGTASPGVEVRKQPASTQKATDVLLTPEQAQQLLGTPLEQLVNVKY
jgi:hypothetical protein